MIGRVIGWACLASLAAGCGGTTGSGADADAGSVGAADAARPAGEGARDAGREGGAEAADAGPFDGAPDVDGTDVDATPVPPPEPGTHFAETASLWEVPREAGAGHFSVDVAGYQGFSDRLLSTCIDMDGDRRPDLVVTSTFGPPEGYRVFGEPGDPLWQVHLNDGARFAERPHDWSIPNDGFWTPHQGRGQITALVDLDGDRRPELVQIGEVVDHEWNVLSDGGAHFVVYQNDRHGFARAGVRWDLPRGFPTARNASIRRLGNAYWALRDLDGDGLIDLVWTGEEAPNQPLGSPEAPSWHLHRNLGGRFDAEPVVWRLPLDGDGGEGIFSVDHAPISANPAAWRTYDLTGDGRPDLVVERGPPMLNQFSDEEGRLSDQAGSLLRVYPNVGDGFAAVPLRWALPPLRDAIVSEYCGRRSSCHALRPPPVDLDGDGRPDLVETGLLASPYADAEVFGLGARPYWRVYRNHGGGFVVEPQTWFVPAVDSVEGASWVDGASEVDGGNVWSLFDLDGDGRRDFVRTARTFAGNPVELDVFQEGITDVWLWHRNEP